MVESAFFNILYIARLGVFEISTHQVFLPSGLTHVKCSEWLSVDYSIMKVAELASQSKREVALSSSPPGGIRVRTGYTFVTAPEIW